MCIVPERVHNRTLPATDVIVVPMPCLGVDGLTDAAKHAQAAEVVVLDVMIAKTAQQTDRGRCGIELCQFVLVDSLPIA